MAKITPREKAGDVVIKTKADKKADKPGDWWNAGSKKELGDKLLGTAAFLKEQNGARYRQAAIYARLYGNLPLAGVAGSSMRMPGGSQLPVDRPTMSIITSLVDTIVSRLSLSRPKPMFLTDGGDYKQRKLAKELNSFIAGELYQTKAYELTDLILRDACVLGTGVVKILEDQEKRVTLERRLCTDLLVDPNDALYGSPRQMYELKLIDRDVMLEMFPKSRSDIQSAEQAYPDNSGESQKTVSDQIMVVEGWRLPSGPDANDGLHAIACSEGVLFDEDYKKKKFPFEMLHYAPRMLGLWAQGVAERQLGKQVEVNKLLMTITKSLNLVGVPRVFVEKGSKIVKSHLNNEVGAIVEYSGTPPTYAVAQCVPMELYQQLERLEASAYKDEGVSQLAAQSQKPAGLDSGEAIREYDGIQQDRLSTLDRRREEFIVNVAYQIIDKAKDIAERDGSYQTVFPDKNGVQQVDLPAAKLLENPFVIQCFDTSSLPKDPAGRAQKIAEFMQAGIFTPAEGRRLLNFPDTEEMDKLANAAEERVTQVLDKIVEDGKFTPPDPFMDLQLAGQLCTQYYNLYVSANLEESRAEMLRNFFSQTQALIQQATTPPPNMAPGAQPQANPMPAPQSDLIPNVPGQGQTPMGA